LKNIGYIKQYETIQRVLKSGIQRQQINGVTYAAIAIG